MEFLKSFFGNEIVKKTLAIILLIVLLYSIRSVLNLLLLTFIFAFLIYGIQKFLFKQIDKVVHIKEKYITIFIYFVLVVAVVFGLTSAVHHIGKDFKGISKTIDSIQTVDYTKLSDEKFGSAKITDSILTDKNIGMLESNIENYGKQALIGIFHALPHLSEISMQFILAIVLSFFLLLGKEEIKSFCSKLEDSNIRFLYGYYKELGVNFANTFGKILQIQVLISLINATLSALALMCLHFHQVVGLGFMMFIFGLVPVAGAVISFVPLAVIGFTIGGFTTVLEVLVMILAIHFIETYFLSPKLMAHETKLPMFIAFLTLIISEHFLGTWGLLLGIPMLMFLLDICGVKVKEDKK